MSKIFLVNKAFRKGFIENGECCADCQYLRWGCDECDCHICDRTNRSVENVGTHTCDDFKAIEHKDSWEVEKEVEISPSDLELLKKLIKYCFEYGIVDDSDDSLTSIHLKALLKKLESLK